MADERQQVVVVGSGIAGLVAALELGKRGYEVTLYENKHVLGGNVGSFPRHAKDPEVLGDEDRGPWYDVYPHMFAAFYRNFWRLVEEDLGIEREKAFDPRDKVQVLNPDGTYSQMTDIASAESIWKNLTDGPQPAADMVVSMYALLDLLAQPIHRRQLLSSYSVSGFLSSRPYMTLRAASLHDYLLLVVWSVHSYGVSAASYKDFFRFGLPKSTPLNWVLRGDSYHTLIKPLEEKLTSSLGVKIVMNTRVTELVVAEDGHVSRLETIRTHYDPTSGMTEITLDDDGNPITDTIEVSGDVVLAVSPKPMAELAQSGNPTQTEQAGLRKFYDALIQADERHREYYQRELDRVSNAAPASGLRVIELAPELSESRQARAEPIAVANLYFTEKIPDIPPGHVSLGGSRMNLSFLDLSQLWESLEGEDSPTVLTVAASNYYGLPAAAETDLGRYRDLVAMLEELQKYLPQLKRDNIIDWDRSHFHTNMSGELFINDVASENWRPTTWDERVPNLFLAGGYCVNDVGMATVEGAVMTGLVAARTLHEKRTEGAPRNPVEILEHKAYADSTIHAMKLAMMPWAYSSKWVSAMSDIAVDAAGGKPAHEWGRDLMSLWMLPLDAAQDVYGTTMGLCLSLWNEVVKPR